MRTGAPCDRSLTARTRVSLAWVLSLLVGLALTMGLPSAARAQATAQAYEQAQALVREKSWAAASEVVAAGLLTHPRDARLRLLQGVIAAQQLQPEQAQGIFEALIADHPELSEPYNNLGILLAQRSDVQGARQQFEKALLADPQNAQAQSNLARLATPQ